MVKGSAWKARRAREGKGLGTSSLRRVSIAGSSNWQDTRALTLGMLVRLQLW